MKSLIKPLMVAVLAAALCMLLKSFVLPYALLLLLPDSWAGPGSFLLNLGASGFIAGLVVVRLLPAQRYFVALMLIPVFSAVIITGYALNRCSVGQLSAIDQLSEQTWTNLGNSEASAPQTSVDLSDAPGVTRDNGGYNYSCIRPGETRDYFLTAYGLDGVAVLGLLMALLLTSLRGTTDTPRRPAETRK